VPSETRLLPTVTITSSGSGFTNAIQFESDAGVVGIFVTTSVGGTFFSVQVSPYEDSLQYSGQYPMSSNYWADLYQTTSSTLVTVPAGGAVMLGAVAWQKMRLKTSAAIGVETSGQIVAYITKQFSV
jgi:hypothetical protein